MTVPHLNMDEAQNATGPYHDGEHRLIGRSSIMYNRSLACQARPSGSGATGFDYVGYFGATTTAPASSVQTNGDDASGPWQTCTTSATINTDAGSIPTPNTVFFRGSWAHEFRANIKLGATLTTARYWIGLFRATPMALTANPTTADIAAFRYDTGLDGTAFLRTVTANNVASTVTALTAADGAAVSASKRFDLRIKIEAIQGAAPNKVMFYIDDTLVRVELATLPRADQYLMPIAAVRCLAGSAARAITINQIINSTTPVY